MKFLTSITLLCTLITTSFALPAEAPPNLLNAVLEALGLNGLVGNGVEPLPTTVHSPECADLNNGTYVCCQSTFNGGMPIIEEASALTDYPITKNTINGLIDCECLFCPAGT